MEEMRIYTTCKARTRAPLPASHPSATHRRSTDRPWLRGRFKL